MTELVRHPALPKIPNFLEGEQRKWAKDLLDFVKRQAQATYDQQYHDDLVVKGPWVDVRAYGATGDGSTDDTTAIQNAVNAAAVAGGCVYFPPGEFKIISTINCGTSDEYDPVVWLQGFGTGPIGTIANQTTIIKNYGNDHAIRTGSLGLFKISGISIQDGLSAAARTAGAGVYGYNDTGTGYTHQIRIENVWIDKHVYGVQLHKPVVSLLEHVTCANNEQDAFWIVSDAIDAGTSTTFGTCWARSPGRYGFNIEGLKYSTLIGCACDGATSHGYYFNRGSNNMIPAGLSMISCGAEQSGGDNIHIDGVTGMTIVGGYSIGATGDGIAFGTTTSDAIQIFGTEIDNNTGYGIDAQSLAAGQTRVEAYPRIGTNTAGAYNDPNNVMILFHGGEYYGRIRNDDAIWWGTIYAFTDGDTTPSVKNRNRFKTANTGATTITMFDDPAGSQEIIILFGDGNTTVQHNTNYIYLAGGANKTFAQYDVLRLFSDGTKWYEITRSENHA